MRIVAAGDRLELRDTPGAMWVLGLVFVASGLFVLAMPLVADEWAGFAWWERLAILAIGAAHLAGGLSFALAPAATRTVLDRSTGLGAQRVRTLARRPPSHVEFRLAEVRSVEVVRSTDSDGDPTFQLRLWLAGSRPLWLQAQPQLGEAHAQAQAARIRDFLGLAAPASPPSPR